MGVWFASVAVLGLLWGPPQATVRSELAALSASDSQTRVRAQAWLLENLAPRDAELCWQAAQASELDARYALSQVLAGHPRHFGLCAEALLHPDANVQAVGAWALEQLALVWNPALQDPPRRLGELPEEWVDLPSREIWVEPRAAGASLGLSHALECLQTELDLPLELVLDPDLAPGRSLTREPLANLPDLLTGAWPQVLEFLVRGYRASGELWGWRPSTMEESPDLPPRPFFRVRRAGKLQNRSGPEMLIEWVRGAAQADDRRLARASATALAECGWPVALAWLDSAFVAGRAEFLPALAIAAERGRVARVWTTKVGLEAVVQALADEASSAAQDPSNAWALVARALQHAPHFVDDETPLAAILLLSDEGALAPRWTWLACTAYVGRGVSHPVLLERAWAAVLDRSSAKELRMAAVLALASMRSEPRPGVFVGSDDVLEGLAPSLQERVTAALEALGLAPDPASLAPSRPTAGARRALWFTSVKDLKRATAQLQTVLRERGNWQEVLAVFRAAVRAGRKASVESLLDALRSAPDGAAWADRLGFALGFGSRLQAEARWSALFAEGRSLGAEDWLDVAYLIQWDRLEARVRGALVGALGQGVPSEDLEPALWAAMEGLRAKRLPVQIEDFDGDLRRAANRAQHPLTQVLLDWNGGLRAAPSPTEALGALQLQPPK